MENGDLIQSFINRSIKTGELDKRLIKVIAIFLSVAITIQTVIPTFIGQKSVRKGNSPRHGIKRMHRLLSNFHLTPRYLNTVLMRNFLWRMAGNKMFILALDWTMVRDFCFLSVSLVWNEGRCVPLQFYGYKKQELERSQTEIEHDAILSTVKHLRSTLGTRLKIIWLADRGFDASATLDLISKNGCFYAIRASTESNCWKSNGRKFKLRKYLVKKGQKRELHDIIYCERRGVRTNLYCIWQNEQKEPWLILSNIRFKNANSAGNLYARRMTIEEMFRSMKNERDGFDLRVVRLRHLDRWLRFLGLAGILFQLLAMVGSVCRVVPEIEKRYTMSSRIPKGQNHILSVYVLAVRMLQEGVVQFKFTTTKFYLKFPQTRWLLV
jgi:hypothetical protein